LRGAAFFMLAALRLSRMNQGCAMESESQFFVPLAEVAAAVCRPKKTIENWLDSGGCFVVAGKKIQTIKVGGLRVVARPVLDDLILHLLQQAGVSPAAAAQLVSRQPAAPNQEVPSSPPSAPRRPGRPRKTAAAAGGSK
jgi:phosphatidylserine synthase